MTTFIDEAYQFLPSLNIINCTHSNLLLSAYFTDKAHHSVLIFIDKAYHSALTFTEHSQQREALTSQHVYYSWRVFTSTL